MDCKVKIYALSTCGWCKRTVKWMEDNKVEFEITYVDKLDGSEREKVLEEMKRFNPKGSFPTVVIDDGRSVVVGYRPEKFEEEIGK